jgi:DNA-binding response OmpR family regulator
MNATQEVFEQKQLRILLFGGTARTRDAIRQTLENAHFELTSAATNSDALGLVLLQSFGTVIACLDQDRDGNFVLLAVKRHWLPDSRIIAVSNCLDAEVATAARLRVDVVVTPFSIEQVTEFIHSQVREFKSPSSSEPWTNIDKRNLA